jgi:6-pyruvoyltetrahydropterin/6-carboxytetrahydropterin synthase
MEIFRAFGFEAAHLLPNVSEGHKCGRLHGHSYRIEVHVAGEVGETTGMVIDFADLSAAVQPLVERLDHRYLNEIDGLDNPTSENLARWLWERLAHQLHLSRIVVRETCTSGVSYSGV